MSSRNDLCFGNAIFLIVDAANIKIGDLSI